MATSGTTNFELDFTDVAEESWERAGREMRSGYDLRTARRSMNLLTIEWQNRGINLWTITEGEVSMVMGEAVYVLPADLIDVIEMVVRTGTGTAQQDLSMSRVSVSTYAAISAKLIQGRPIQAWVERDRVNPILHVWPVPDRTGHYTLKYWALRRIEDAGSGVETPDVNFRFYPALVAGLAYYLAMKTPDLSSRLPILEAEYLKQFKLAAEEDREKASWRIVPRIAR